MSFHWSFHRRNYSLNSNHRDLIRGNLRKAEHTGQVSLLIRSRKARKASHMEHAEAVRTERA